MWHYLRLWWRGVKYALFMLFWLSEYYIFYLWFCFFGKSEYVEDYPYLMFCQEKMEELGIKYADVILFIVMKKSGVKK